MYAIARRVRIDHYRRNKTRRQREIPRDQLPERAAQETRAPALPELQDVLSLLPPAQQEVVLLLCPRDHSRVETQNERGDDDSGRRALVNVAHFAAFSQLRYQSIRFSRYPVLPAGDGLRSSQRGPVLGVLEERVYRTAIRHRTHRGLFRGTRRHRCARASLPYRKLGPHPGLASRAHAARRHCGSCRRGSLAVEASEDRHGLRLTSCPFDDL